MVKNDEINSNTGDIEVIMNFKTIHSTPEQIAEIFQISQNVNGLSPYDIINYILARDHQAILATGDKKLKNFAENQGIEVMRTLKIIQLLKAKKSYQLMKLFMLVFCSRKIIVQEFLLKKLII